MSHSINIISRQASSCPLICVLSLPVSPSFFLFQRCCEQLRKSSDPHHSVKGLHERAEGGAGAVKHEKQSPTSSWAWCCSNEKGFKQALWAWAHRGLRDRCEIAEEEKLMK
jgi:hypothetical protein